MGNDVQRGMVHFEGRCAVRNGVLWGMMCDVGLGEVCSVRLCALGDDVQPD